MSAVEAVDLRLGGALRGVGFALPTGSCAAILGPNGSGKSTLMGLLAGALRPDAGQARCAGPVAYLPEGLGLDGLLTVGDAVALVAGLPGWDPAVGPALLHELALPPGARVGGLSLGQRVRLGVALTLGRRARVYLLDDPFLGLDPMAQVRVERAIAHRAAEATVVFAGQRADAAERLADHLLVLRGGELLWAAPVEAWRGRFRQLRVSGEVDLGRVLGEQLLRAQPRGAAVDALVDDPAGAAEARLRLAGARVEPAPLPLDELLLWVTA